METSFYIKAERLDEYKKFIRTLPSARFISNPYKIGNEYNINLSLSSDDGNKLSEFENVIAEFDKIMEPKKESLIDKLLKLWKTI